MSRPHEAVVGDQFGPRAQAYVESAVHAAGGDLDALETIVGAAKPERALDLGAGGGHVAYLMARHAAKVTACDLSADMLSAVAATARSKGLSNIETVQAPAERLPFADAAFDFLGCRYSAHHWRDLAAGLGEARRVMRTGAPAIFMDAYSPGAPLLDTHLQAIELLRDVSHVRDYSLGEWAQALSQRGFAIRAVRTWRVRLDFASWTERMRTPEVNKRAIRALQTTAPTEARAHFAVEDDGSFTLDVTMLETSAD